MATGHSGKREAVNKLKVTATESTNQISLCLTEFKNAHRNGENDQESLESIETEVYDNVLTVYKEQRRVLDEVITELQDKCIMHMKRETAGRNKDPTKSTGDSGIYSTDSTIIAEEKNGDGIDEDFTGLKGIITNPTSDETEPVTLSGTDGTLSTGKRHPQRNGDEHEDCTGLKCIDTNPTLDETGPVTHCLRDGTLSTDKQHQKSNDDGHEDCTGLKGIFTNPTPEEIAPGTLCLRDGTLSTGRRNQQENRQGLDLDDLKGIDSVLNNNLRTDEEKHIGQSAYTSIELGNIQCTEKESIVHYN